MHSGWGVGVGFSRGYAAVLGNTCEILHKFTVSIQGHGFRVRVGVGVGVQQGLRSCAGQHLRDPAQVHGEQAGAWMQGGHGGWFQGQIPNFYASASAGYGQWEG